MLPDHRDGRGRWQRVDAEDVLELAEVVDAPLLEQLLVGEDVLRAEDLPETLDDRFSAQSHGTILFAGGSGQWKIGNDRSRTGSVASRTVLYTDSLVRR